MKALSGGGTISLAAALLIVGAGCAKRDPAPAARSVDLAYRFSVRDIPAGAKKIAAWVPLPPTDAHQRLAKFEVTDNRPYRIVTEPEYGNRFLLLDLSRGPGKNGGDRDVAVNFRVKRRAYRAPAGTEKAAKPPSRFLAPDRLIPVNGKIAEEARRAACASRDPFTCARRLYDHIVDTVTYDKSGVGWGRGDALYACDVRKGNCTDFHSLFIGEARSLAIPARFVMGLPLPEDGSRGAIPGYHCWAEFYVEGRGWIPVDASEASRFPEKREAFFGGLDENRVAFTVGRDIRLPGASTGPLNYVIFPHVEVDGKTYGNVETHFSFEDVKEGVKS